MGFAASKVVGWAYTAVAVVATFLVGRRTVRDEEKPLVWLAILVVATLRSPFLPEAYGGFPAMWLLTLLAAQEHPHAKALWYSVPAWLALNFYWPLDWPIDPKLLASITLLPQAAIVVIAVHVLRRALAGQLEMRTPASVVV